METKETKATKANGIEMPKVDGKGFTSTLFKKPLPQGKYSMIPMAKAEVIEDLFDVSGKKRVISGQHSVKMQFVDVVNGGSGIIRSATLENLKFKHSESVQSGTTTKEFYTVIDSKNYLNADLLCVSDGKDIDVI